MKKKVGIFLSLLLVFLFISCDGKILNNTNTGINPTSTSAISITNNPISSSDNNISSSINSIKTENNTTTTPKNTTSSTPKTTIATPTSSKTTTSITPTSTKTSSETTTSTSKTTTSTPTSTKTSTSTITSTKEEKLYTLSEIIEIGKGLDNNKAGIEVKFSALYVKKITDNNDILMLFVDEDAYLNLRVSQNQITEHIRNRYTYCYYNVTGIVSKLNGVVEVNYKSIENKTTTPISSYDFSNITKKVDSIDDLYKEYDNITLNDKYNGTGIIVTFDGTLIATDRSDSNTKGVFTDYKHVVTVIVEKSLSTSNIGKTLKITGILNVLKGQPAILALSNEESEVTYQEDYSNAVEVTPSYFSKWYHVSKKINDPNYSDFAKLYKITGYVNIDESRTSAFHFGLTDNANGNLSDNGVDKSIKGVYMMNYLNMKKSAPGTFEDIYNAYQNENKIAVYASLYQFDTQNHGWKVFIVDDTLKTVEE